MNRPFKTASPRHPQPHPSKAAHRHPTSHIRHKTRQADHPLGNSTPIYRPRKPPHAGIGNRHIFMPSHVNVVAEYVKRPQPKPGDAAHVGARRWQRPVLPLRAWKTLIAARANKSKTLVKTEEKLRRWCLGPQMKTSARHPERYGRAEPWTSAVLRLPNCQQQPTRRAGEMPHAATNVASAAHVLARRVESLSPTSSEAASRRDAGGAKTSPHAPTRRGPHKADETENLLGPPQPATFLDM
jgi:hypothetical protein